MDDMQISLSPRFVNAEAMSIVGLKKRYTDATYTQIPAQWQAFFNIAFGRIDKQKGNVAFGVICNRDSEGNWHYLTGVELSHFSSMANDLDGVLVSPQTYAVFRHDSHVSQIRRTCEAIFDQWLPSATYKIIDAPWFERYGENFNPQTCDGDIEIWIPVDRWSSVC
jgi:AraC family transcriptional regulator